MTSAHAALRLAPVLLILPGCTGLAGLSEDAPPGYSIAGTWTLDPAHSTDSGKVLAALRAEGERDRRRGPGAGPGGSSGPSPGPDAGPDTGPDAGPPGPTDPGTGADPRSGRRGAQNFQLSGGPDRYRPPLDLQTAALRGGEWLQIRQNDAEVDIASTGSSRSFTPGSHSVVSVPSGVADQNTGWKGHNYVVELQPQVGPRVVESYGLSGDGQQLIVNISVGSEGRNRPIQVTRVYQRSAAVPLTLPFDN